MVNKCWIFSSPEPGDESQGVSFEEMLIAAVQEREVLWDTTLPVVVRSKNARDQAWLEIKDSFKGEDFISIFGNCFNYIFLRPVYTLFSQLFG